MIFAPTVNGTIGTAVSTAPSTQVTITPTFTNGNDCQSSSWISHHDCWNNIVDGNGGEDRTTSAMGKWF